MKSITDQVDEFIEGWHDGSILYINIDRNHLSSDKIWISELDSGAIDTMKQCRETLNNNVQDYLRDDGNKENTARKIFRAVLTLRSLGVIQTNATVSKDIQFFKERCKQLESENEELLQAYAQAKEKITTLTSKPSSDFKGVS